MLVFQYAFTVWKYFTETKREPLFMYSWTMQPTPYIRKCKVLYKYLYVKVSSFLITEVSA